MTLCSCGLTYNNVPQENPERILYASHLSNYLTYSSKQNRDPCLYGAYNQCTFEYVHYIALLGSNKHYDRKGALECRDKRHVVILNRVGKEGFIKTESSKQRLEVEE